MSKRGSDTLTLITFLVLLIGGCVAAFFMIEPFVPYIILGAILALLSDPLYRFFLRRGWRPRWAALTVTILFFLVVTGPLSLFVSRAVEQGIAFGQSLAARDGLSLDGIMEKVKDSRLLKLFWGDPATIQQKLNAELQGAGRTLSTLLVAQLSGIPGMLLHGVIALVTCYFFLTDGPNFLDWFSDKVPLDADVKRKLKVSFRDTSVSVIWAAMAAAGTQALILLFGFLVLGLPDAFLAAGAAFLLAWIPLIGISPVWILAAVFLAANGQYGKMIGIIIFGLIAGIADNIVRPLVLRGRNNMHPVVSLIAIFGGVRIFGLLGIFYGPILASLVISLLQVWPAVGDRWGFTYGTSKPTDHLSPTEP